MTFNQIMAEMARRKVRFHPNEEWDKISCFGLFQWGIVSRYLVGNEKNMKNFSRPLFINEFDLRRENKTLWVKPTKECWEKYIQPLIARYSLDELTIMAGWDF